MKYFFLLSLVLIACSCQNKAISLQEQPGVFAELSGHQKLTKTQDGNEYSNIHCSLIDKAGNLWFGTMKEGVYRYDGKQFVQITVANGLTSNTVWSMVEDTAGNIWFGTDHGLSMFDGKHISAMVLRAVNDTTYKNNERPKPYFGYEVWSMLCDRSGKVWIGTTNGVYCFDGKQFTHFLLNDGVINKKGLQLKGVQCMLQDDKGNIWFGSGPIPGNEGLCRYDGKELVQFNPGGATWIRFMVQDRKGMLWLATRNQGNWRYDGNSFTKYTEKEGIGAPVLLDKAGNIWFTGDEDDNGYSGKGGIWRFDGTSFRNITTKDGLGNYGVWTMVEDRAGNVWVGTRNNGLYRYDGKSVTSFSE